MEEEHAKEAFVYRVAPEAEWDAARSTGAYHGGKLDGISGFIHLSTGSQVPDTLQRFFAGRSDLFLLKIDVAKIAQGLQWDLMEGLGTFPHYYGPSGSFAALPLQAVVEWTKLELNDGRHTLPPSLTKQND